MNPLNRSDAYYLLFFFMVVIAIGTVFLMLPVSWVGFPGDNNPLALVDALFTATSAVCVTGLSTVNTTGFSRFGQIIIMLLIQIGGLGIVSFTSILMTIPGNRIPLRRLNTIRSFSVQGVEYNAKKIVRNIILFTFCIEAVGAALLSMFFYYAGIEDWFFAGIFHAVSSFCNAGFSNFSDNLSGFTFNIPVQTVIMLLIISGGLGFIVLNDTIRRIFRKKKRLSYHSTVVLAMTGILIILGAVWFLIMEYNRSYAGMDFPVALSNAFFQAVTPRTAGFETVPQNILCDPSKIMTSVLMIIGGAPGSIAGGVKITTIFVVVAVLINRPDKNGDIKIRRHRLGAETIHNGILYFLKAIVLLLICITLLSIVENRDGASIEWIIFEVFSAFGTVGLTLGLTPELSVLGKIVVVATMFAGRVGLIALAFPKSRHKIYDITYPEGNIILG